MTEKYEIAMQLKQILIYLDYHPLNMEQNVMIQILTGHLNGKSLREIAAERDISKDAAANVIRDWKNGKINFLQNAIPEESFIVDLAKYLKKAGITFEEIPVALVQIK